MFHITVNQVSFGRIFEGIIWDSGFLIFYKRKKTCINPMKLGQTLADNLPVLCCGASPHPCIIFHRFYFCCTFFCWAASSTGQQSCTLWSLDLWQTEQMSSSSLLQNTLSLSLWFRQTSWSLLVLCA